MGIVYRLRLLGTVGVEKDGVPTRNFESRKALALLGYLARQHQPVSRSEEGIVKKVLGQLTII